MASKTTTSDSNGSNTKNEEKDDPYAEKVTPELIAYLKSETRREIMETGSIQPFTSIPFDKYNALMGRGASKRTQSSGRSSKSPLAPGIMRKRSHQEAPAVSSKTVTPRSIKKAKTTTAKSAKKQRPRNSYALTWRGSWGEDEMKIYGIYTSEASAQAAKKELISHYADFLGDSWRNSIDIAIREAPLFLE